MCMRSRRSLGWIDAGRPCARTQRVDNDHICDALHGCMYSGASYPIVERGERGARTSSFGERGDKIMMGLELASSNLQRSSWRYRMTCCSAHRGVSMCV